MTHNESILSIVAGATEQQRLVIVHRSLEPRDTFRVGPVRLYRDDETPETTRDAGPAESLRPTSRPFCEQIHAVRDRPIVLRQESFSPAVGWFSQSEMELTLDQWNVMRTTLVPTNLPSSRALIAPSRKTNRPSAGSLNRRSRILSMEGDVIATESASSRCTSTTSRILSMEGDVIALALHPDQAVPA